MKAIIDIKEDQEKLEKQKEKKLEKQLAKILKATEKRLSKPIIISKLLQKEE